MGIQHGGRLVQNQKLWLHGKGIGHGNALLLAARERVDVRANMVEHAHGIERMLNATDDLFAGKPQVRGSEGNLIHNIGSHQLVVWILHHETHGLTHSHDVVSAHIRGCHPPKHLHLTFSGQQEQRSQLRDG